MKRSAILITFVAFLFFGLNSMAQESSRKKLKDVFKKSELKSKKKDNSSKSIMFSKGQVSKPGNSEDYYWETGSNTWFHSTNSEYSYSETGQLLERLSTDANTGSNMWKDVYAYDSHGEMTESVYYNWNNDTWEVSWGSKYENTYDNNGNMTSQVNYWWDYQTNSWLEEWKDLWVYDNNGHLSEIISQDWENEAWLNNWKQVLTVNTSGLPTELMDYEWEGNDWVVYEKYTGITWHNWLGWNNDGSEPESYTGQYWDDGQWVNSERYNATYSGNNYVGIYEEWENDAWVNSDKETVTRSATEEIDIYEYWENDQWVYESRYTETFDDHGNPTGYKHEYWENGEWVIQYGNNMAHTYNNDGDITETIFSQWDEGTMSMVNYERKVFSNHQHFESGINNLIHLKNVSIYPNPAVSSINIRIDEADVNSYQVDIINITGQTIYSNSFSNLSTTINVEKLNTGFYFIRITANNNKVHNYKLMKD